MTTALPARAGMVEALRHPGGAVVLHPDHPDAEREPEALAPYVLVSAANVKPRKPEWLWRGRMAVGVVTNLEGDPGLGKSTLLLDLAARLSSGRPMPGADVATVPAGDVVVLSAEDDPSCVLRPRLEANGADLARVHFLTAVRDDKGKLQPVSIPRDVDRIAAAVRKVNARMLIVDPPAAYLGKEVDSFKDGSVRLAMAPLQEMAAEHRMAVVFNKHFNKGGGGRAIHKGGGSVAFAAAARTVLQVYPDPEDQDRRVLVVAKCNLARKASSLMFRVASWERDPDVSCIEWEGETERSADELLDAQAVQSQAKKPELDFLREVLAGGPVMAAEIYSQGEIKGFGSDALKRAKTKLGVKSYKEPGKLTGPWYWEMPA